MKWSHGLIGGVVVITTIVVITIRIYIATYGIHTPYIVLHASQPAASDSKPSKPIANTAIVAPPPPAQSPPRSAGTSARAQSEPAGDPPLRPDQTWGTPEQLSERNRLVEPAEVARLLKALKQAPQPERDFMLKKLVRLCLDDRIIAGDAAVIFSEEQERKKRNGEYSLECMESTAYNYWLDGKPEKAIAVLEEGIRVLETGGYKTDQYRGYQVGTPARKAGAIAEIRKDINEYRASMTEEEKPQGSKSTPAAKSAQASSSATKSATRTQAEKLRDENRNVEAAAQFDALGDREEAASSLLKETYKVSSDDAGRIADEVLRKYPDTPQAAHAMYRKAVLYKEAKDTPNYMATLEEMVKRYPDSDKSLDVRFQLAHEFIQQGNDDKAIAFLDDLYRHGIDKDKTVYSQAIMTLIPLYGKRHDDTALKALVDDAVAKLEDNTFKMDGIEATENPLQRAAIAEQLRQMMQQKGR